MSEPEKAAPDKSSQVTPGDNQALLKEVTEKAHRVMQAAATPPAAKSRLSAVDPQAANRAFADFGAKLMAQPEVFAAAQQAMWSKMSQLVQNKVAESQGRETSPVVKPEKGDRRFTDDAWSRDFAFDFIKQTYLLNAGWALSLVDQVEGLDDATRERVRFFTRQYLDSIAPGNFAQTNPTVLRTAAETGGENLLRGLSNLLDDMERSEGPLQISRADRGDFELGKDLAVTPGKVIFRNDLMELIQYTPTTEEVHKRPLLIVPPWINKYYVFDLQPKNSFVKWIVAQGTTVFLISWVNPDESLAHKSFDDYMLEGPLAALDAIEENIGEKEVNLAGYCIGGTLSAVTLAHMAAKKDRRVTSLTLMACMLDFSDPGEVGVFMEPEQLDYLEKVTAERGYLEGYEMAGVFSMLRANDLIWSYVVGKYLMGEEGRPFDMVYWFSDTTRLPARMIAWYLKNAYMANKLVEPGALSLAGTPLDLSKIKVPTYMLSTVEDHISPWKSTYAGRRLLKGNVKFVLGGSGHNAGVVNPPDRKKYGYWTSDAQPDDPEAWLAAATKHDGSWWPDWQQWLAKKGGPKVAARDPENGGLKPLADAPGSYVKVR